MCQLKDGAVGSNAAEYSTAVQVTCCVQNETAVGILAVPVANEGVECALSPTAASRRRQLENSSKLPDAERDRCAVEISGCILNQSGEGIGSVVSTGKSIDYALCPGATSRQYASLKSKPCHSRASILIFRRPRTLSHKDYQLSRMSTQPQVLFRLCLRRRRGLQTRPTLLQI